MMSSFMTYQQVKRLLSQIVVHYLVIFGTVGMTPQRRDFVYSRQFTKTKPHSELLEQFDLGDIKESDTEVNKYCDDDY